MKFLDNSHKLILDLCGGTGAWSKPYKEENYDVKVITLPKFDVRLFEKPQKKVYGVLAAPPCTHFCVSGSRWWKEKGDKALLEGLSILDACFRIIAIARPKFWCLENPIGRLVHYLGEPTLIFHPWEFALYDDLEKNNYTKRTCLWGKFNIPTKKPGPKPHNKTFIWYCGEKNRSEIRSITPSGFAKAFFLANH